MTDPTPAVYPSKHPLVAHKLTLLRDVHTPPKRFREYLHEISLMLAYEATTDLPTALVPVTTPLSEAEGVALTTKIGLIPILRAGLGMVEGFWQIVPGAEVWHLGLYRDEETLQPVTYYNKLTDEPNIDVAFILDPMLATGGSASAAIQVLTDWGVEDIRLVCVLAAPEGIAAVHKRHPEIPIYTAAVDSHLNDIGYIVPGLGDAGDRQFGTSAA